MKKGDTVYVAGFRSSEPGKVEVQRLHVERIPTLPEVNDPIIAKRGGEGMSRDRNPRKEIPLLAKLFAMQLRRRREAAGLSQLAVAARAGYTTGYVHQLEKGERVPTLETIEHFCNALNVKDPRFMFRSSRRR